MKKRIFVLLLVMTVICGLVACGEKQESSGSVAETSHPDNNDPNRIVLETPLILVDDENLRVEVTGFHQDIRYKQDKTEYLEKFLDFKLTNRTEHDFSLDTECYIGDEMGCAAFTSSCPAPGKSARMSLYIRYSDQSPLESMEQLYTLNGIFELRLEDAGGTMTGETIEAPFSIPAALAGDPVAAAPETPETVSIDAIAVDDSFRKKDGSDLMRVHLFYTVKATDKNLEVDSKYTKMKINNVNEYSGAHYFNALDYAPSYLYQDYLRDVYMGSEQKVATTFEIPSADLAPGRSITLSDTQVPGMDKLKLNTDDIQHFASMMELCETIDPLGYAQAVEDRSLPSDAILKEVNTKLRTKIWGAQEESKVFLLEIKANGTYEFTSNTGMFSPGIYTITRKYITLKEDGSGTVLEIPYSYENGELHLDVATAIDNGKN